MAKEKKRRKPRTKTLKAAHKNDTYYDWAFDNLDKIRQWAAEGAKISDIVKGCGTNRTTFAEWRRRHPELDLALKEGRDSSNHDVECALLKKALGYERDEVETTTVTDGSGQVVTRTERKKTKHVEPDVRAIEFFLGNRERERWGKSTNDVNLTGGVLLVPDNSGNDWAQMVKEQQEKLAKAAQDAAEEVLNGDDGDEHPTD